MLGSIEEYFLALSKAVIDASDFTMLSFNELECLTEEEINKLVTLIQKHKMQILYNWLSLNNNCHIQTVYEKIIQKRAYHWKELIEIIQLLNLNKISYVLVKGVALSSLLYNDPYMRGTGDIDIIVQDDNFDLFFELLKDKGYYRLDGKEIVSSEVNYGIYHHEISMTKTINGFDIIAEVKKRSSCTSSFESWWKFVTEKEINGVPLKVLNNDAELLHLFLNTFHNNESSFVSQNCRLRDYFDVAYAIKHIDICWDNILKMAEELQVTHQIQIVLQSTSELYELENETSNILEKIRSDYCRYQEKPFYYGIDRIPTPDFGLVSNRPRAAMTYSIFDKDFSTYQWNKSYKAVIYSKKNPDYLQRLHLQENASTPYYQYFNKIGINAKYRFYRNDGDFIVEIDIDHSCKDFFENNRCIIEVTSYINDINSPAVIVKNHTPEITNLLDVNWNIPVEGKYLDRFSSSKYKIMLLEEPKIEAYLSTSHYENFTRVQFSFSKEKIYYPLDVVLWEVKFVLLIKNGEENISINQGTSEHFIECDD